MRDVGLLVMKLQFLLIIIKLLRQLKCSEMAIINPSIRQDEPWRGVSSSLPHGEDLGATELGCSESPIPQRRERTNLRNRHRQGRGRGAF